MSFADTILFNGKITTMDPDQPEASAVAVKDGKIHAVGSDLDMMTHKGLDTDVIDLKGQRTIPG